MDSLPPEIWEHIFYFACSDNGSTGRALSLVSRNMHQIVKPHKLRSISIVGGPQIIKFSEFLSSISASYIDDGNCNTPSPQATIQNLFVGVTNPRLFPPLTTSSDVLLKSALNSLSLLNDSGILPSPPTTIPAVISRGNKDGDRVFIVKAVHRIIRLVAPTLHTLHFHITPDILSSTPFLFPMPRLSELTVYGPLLVLGPHTVMSSTISQSELLTTFPSLKLLRLGNFHALPTDFLPRMTISMPQLTHISLFQPLSSPRHVHSLGRLIMSPESYVSSEALKRIIIEVDVNSVLFEENSTNNGTKKLMQWLEILGDCMHQTADTRVRLIESHRSWVDVETAQIDWSKRNMGMRWAASFRIRHSIMRSAGIPFQE